MREYTDLSDSFYEKVFDGGIKNISLPLVIPFKNAPGTLELECVFTPPEESGQNCFFLELERISGKYEIYCNSEKVTAFKSVYSRVCAELTDCIVQNAANLLRIVIAPAERADSAFAFGGAGIVMTDKTHFGLGSDCSDGINVRTVINGSSAHISVKAQTVNANNYDVAVFTLFDPDGRAVETRAEKPTAAVTEFIVDAPELWDGPHSTALYTVEALLRRDSVILDRVTRRFGIRDFSITKDGFFCVNGIKNPLCGAALTDFSAVEDDFELLRRLDANCVMINGLPADEDILTRCDEAGITAWLNIPTTDSQADLDEISRIAASADAHPSLAVISTASNDPGFAKSWCGAIKRRAQFVYPALFSDIMNSEGIIDAVPDILVLNIPAKTGLNDFIRLENRFSELRAEHPAFRFAVLADSPECITDRHSSNAVRCDCSQEYFSAWHEKLWNAFCTQKNVIGMFAGALSDKTEKSCRTGLVTADREEKKDAFWFYRAQFSASGFVRLCSSGQTTVTSKYADIKCYSNTPNVRITVNGKENSGYACEKLSDCVYIFRGVKLKRRNNTIVVTSGSGTDSEVIFRSRSRLSKK